MYLDGRIIEQKKHGLVVCIAKTDIPTTPADYSLITLLNTDYKIIARIIANRLRPTISDVLYPSQYSGVPGNTIFDAVATVRYAVAYAELTHVPLYILSLDFTTAFDRILHTYLFRMLNSYG
jgi:Reverse transcriptase (RNA-dependent DNA polymerase).